MTYSLRARIKTILSALRPNPNHRPPVQTGDREEHGRDASREGDDIRAAVHADDPFSEPRQVEQLQRLLNRYEQAKRDRSDH